MAAVPGIEDMEAANGKVFVAVASARGPDARDGIYALKDGKLTRLAGTPKDFHPRGISLYHGARRQPLSVCREPAQHRQVQHR